MIDFSSPDTVSRYNYAHHKLAGTGLMVNIALLVYAVISSLPDFLDPSSLSDTGFGLRFSSILETSGSESEDMWGVILYFAGIALTVMYIFYLVRLFMYRSFLRSCESEAEKGVSSLINSIWIAAISAGLLVFVVFTAIILEGDISPLKIFLIPIMGLIIAFSVEMSGFAVLKKSTDLQEKSRKGFSLLFLSDIFLIAAQILLLFVQADLPRTMINALAILSLLSSFTSICVSIAGWRIVRTPAPMPVLSPQLPSEPESSDQSSTSYSA